MVAPVEIPRTRRLACMPTKETDHSRLRRRDYLKTTGVAAASVVGLAGCLGAADATGTLATEVTDQPGDIADFESCVVTIQGIWLKPRGDDNDDGSDDENGSDDGDDEELAGDDDGANVDRSDARTYYEFDESQEADLVELQDGNTQLIDDREVPAREYEFLQLDVTDVEGVLEGGETAEVDTPGSAPLQFKERFEIREGQRTTFVADFTPVRRGRTDEYLLKPVASGTKVIYEDDGGAENGTD